MYNVLFLHVTQLRQNLCESLFRMILQLYIGEISSSLHNVFITFQNK